MSEEYEPLVAGTSSGRRRGNKGKSRPGESSEDEGSAGGAGGARGGASSRGKTAYSQRSQSSSRYAADDDDAEAGGRRGRGSKGGGSRRDRHGGGKSGASGTSLETLPGGDFDYVVVFNYGPETDKARRQDVLAKLRATGLTLRLDQPFTPDELFCFLSISESRMEDVAEAMRLPKVLRSKEHQPFVKAKRAQYENADSRNFFTSADRQRAIWRLMTAEEADGCCDFDFMQLTEDGIIRQVYAPHNEAENAKIRATWASFSLFKSRSPTTIRNYCGEQVALYFAWLDYYTTWLIMPAVIGVIVFLFQLIRGGPDKTVLVVFYSFFIVLYFTCFVEFWKRKEVSLAYQWDVMNFEETEEARDEYVPENTVDGKTPTHKRLIKLVVSGTVVTSLIISVIFSTLSILYLKLVLSHEERMGKRGAIVAALINTFSIMTFSIVYKWIATKLTDFENHRTQTMYDDSLLIKNFLFECFNNYFALFFIAYLKFGTLWGEPSSCKGDDCMAELQMQLGIVFFTKSTVAQFIEVGVPYIKAKIKASTTQGVDASEEHLLESRRAPHEGMFSEYNEIVLQFGYVALFAPAFPLAAAIALINNYVEARSDTNKMLDGVQRPRYRQAEDIGSWMSAMNAMLFVAVLTNATLIAFVSSQMTTLGIGDPAVTTPAARWGAVRHWVLAIAFEHIALACKVLIQFLVPDVPDNVARAQEQAREHAKTWTKTEEQRAREEKTMAAFAAKVQNARPDMAEMERALLPVTDA